MEEKIKLVIALFQESKHLLSSSPCKVTSLEQLPPVVEVEMHISCGEKSRGDWHSGTEHSAHFGHYQYHTGHTGGGITLIPVAVSKRRV
jgi:hypothetical protein